MNTGTHITSERRAGAKRWRFNPLRGLEPESLSRHLDAFEAGEMRGAVNIWEHIEQRDDLLRAVISKRKKAVGRNGWTVLPVPNLRPEQKEEASLHAEALEFFYNHLECEHAVDTNERGGFKLLARQMMDAVGKRFAVHEVVWEAVEKGGRHQHRIAPEGKRGLTARFRFVPLCFFENTTGRLRFLEHEGAMEGRELEPGAWMVTVGEGLMVASSTAWMFKNISLNDWLLFSQRNGTPGVRGISSAMRDSDEWRALETSVGDLLSGHAVVHGSGDDIKVIDLAAGGNIPYPPLVERVDRLMATLWRGADLSTLSRDKGYGASVQEKETCTLEEDDAEMLTETLNRYIDEWVIRYQFGQSAKPLAHVKVLTAPTECTTYDLQVDEFLLRHGAPLAVEATLNRYGRTLPGQGEPLLQTGESPAKGAKYLEPGMAHEVGLRNEACGREEQIALANQNVAASAATMELANAFELLQPDWVQISPYGDFPHARGLQRVDRGAAETMVRNFNSFLGKLGRLFGGAPFYVGHPDMPETSEAADRKAYGWITQLEAREDGLYARVKWSDPGLELLRNAHYKFLSPYWEAEEIGRDTKGTIYRPTVLLSVGLTNLPNLPVKPLANEEGSSRREEAKISPSVETNACDSSKTTSPSLLTPVPTNKEVEVDCALGNAFAHGRITPVQEEYWRFRLTNDYANASADLGRLNPIIHTVSLTNGLGVRKGEAQRLQNRRGRIQEFVAAKMRTGMTYDEAWDSAKRERGQWFEEMEGLRS